MHAIAPVTALAIRNVLIATDFSPCSERALLHAVAAAHHFGSTLHVVHVVQPAMFCFSPPEAYVACNETANKAVEMARADAEAMMKVVLRRTHCEDLDHKECVQLGAIGEALRDVIQRESIDLAVVGTHGKTGLRKIFLGSVAEEVFRNAPCPVLTVGPHSWRSDPQSVHLKQILFPTDFSAESLRALPFAIATATEFNAAITMFTVIQSLGGEASHDRARVVTALRERMREMVSRVTDAPPQMYFEVEFGEIAESVIQHAAGVKADLIVFGLKAPHSYRDHLPWMHAYKVVCEAACPVLTLRGGWHRT